MCAGFRWKIYVLICFESNCFGISCSGLKTQNARIMKSLRIRIVSSFFAAETVSVLAAEQKSVLRSHFLTNPTPASFNPSAARFIFSFPIANPRLSKTLICLNQLISFGMIWVGAGDVVEEKCCVPSKGILFPKINADYEISEQTQIECTRKYSRPESTTIEFKDVLRKPISFTSCAMSFPLGNDFYERLQEF